MARPFASLFGTPPPPQKPPPGHQTAHMRPMPGYVAAVPITPLLAGAPSEDGSHDHFVLGGPRKAVVVESPELPYAHDSGLLVEAGATILFNESYAIEVDGYVYVHLSAIIACDPPAKLS